jgi:hypothetical protein
MFALFTGLGGIDNGANRFMARSRIRLADIISTICTSNDTIGYCHKYLKRLYTLFYDRVHITTGSFVF